MEITFNVRVTCYTDNDNSDCENMNFEEKVEYERKIFTANLVEMLEEEYDYENLSVSADSQDD